ncbi:hypothetical protein [Rhodococcus sp. IEGM 1330]|uniref:hypothetical protein n=1 Tax=Rhodococcus sp. IEGM 1330 TaxID=3082225 RepID=UPI00295552A5|nr:hypothetical protein [Rhodococcus sp. IEGM 1330]MDV8022000.1 hypothetical protein [Rhodococcus sp. IEGM 1330]
MDIITDDEKIVVKHNGLTDKLSMRFGFLGAVILRDASEARDLIDQLHAALEVQAEHHRRELLRNEDEVRAAAEIREAL